jgi:L-idonate 5-dehydrogenase
MRAAVLFGKHDLRIENLPPAEPGAGEVAVQIAYGGICGSDLSYFTKGRVGDFTVNEPMVLGHEVSGTVAAVGDGVTNVKSGMRVAVNPSRPCLQCDYCRSGRGNLCRNMRFLGSAAGRRHSEQQRKAPSRLQEREAVEPQSEGNTCSASIDSFYT